jgi:enoyl-CoA hydratase/carnithine racemase
MADTVRIERRDRVAIITLSRPAKKNALDLPTWHAFRAALAEARTDPGVHVVLVTGDGGDFCSGSDVADLTSGASKEEHPSRSVIELLCEFDKPLFAAVDGVAVGFGLTMLLHCDIVFVTPGARFRSPFVGLGVVPEAGSTLLLSLRVGSGRAAEIFFSGDFLGGERAVEIGLAQRLVASEDLRRVALETARQVAENSLPALQETKRLLLEARGDAVNAAHQREREAFIELLESGRDDAGAARLGGPERSTS